MSAQKKNVQRKEKPSAPNMQGTTAAKTVTEEKVGFAFGKENYRLLLIGLAFIVLGFVLMIGGGSDDPDVFSYNLFDFRRLTLAPVLVLAGYVIEIFAIMKKPKE